MGRVAAGAGLLAACALALGVRVVRWREVYLGDRVVLPVGDAYYHARRALFSVERWPDVLRFDPLVSFPEGSWIPWPPLHDLLLAAAAHGLGGGIAGVEAAAAWLPPVAATVAVLPVFAAAARLGGRGLGLLAAAIFALLPAHVAYTDLGNADHHCTVSMVGAFWLAAALAAASPQEGRARLAAPLALAAARLAMLLSFPGSILYLAVADGAQVAVLSLSGRARALALHAAGLFACAALVAPVIPWLGGPVGGPWSGIALSWLHVATLLGLAAGAAIFAALERGWPAQRTATRAARGMVVAAALAAAALAVPGLRDGLFAALGFVGKGEPWAALNAEQRALWRGAAGGWLGPLHWYGSLGYAIPVVPVAALALARERRVREPALVLALWTAAFGLLAALQVRYGNDYAPAAAVGGAVLVAQLGRALAPWIGAPLAAGTFATLVLAPLLATAGAQAAASLRLGSFSLLATPAGTLYRFAEEVRAATPETAGFEDPAQRPAYAILCSPNLGHVLHWVARRATTVDNFGPYAGSRHFAEAFEALRRGDEEQVVALARRLGARYVVTMEFGRAEPRSVAQRLHREDGLARGEEPPWAHFRLVTEGPPGGRPLSSLFDLRRAKSPAVPYKLYEVVEGALLEAEAPPGTEVEASVIVVTPAHRRFTYRAWAPAGADGVARLRLPYATETHAPARPVGPWRVRVGGATHEVAVSEQAVREGARVGANGGRG
jgi:dolichyl-diphosphooligosaccharide--protein glycosyltransferase